MFIETGAFIAVTGVLLKLLECLYEYIKKKAFPEDNKSEDIEELIALNREIYQILSKTDHEGSYLVYVPRRLVSERIDDNNLLRTLTHNSEMVGKTLDKLTTSIENIVFVLVRLEDRTSHNK